MAILDENDPQLMINSNVHGGGPEMGQKKFVPEMRQQRRAPLTAINQNLVREQQQHSCLINKRTLSGHQKAGLDLLHRPKTRRFAASNQRCCPQTKPQKSANLKPISSGFEVYVEEEGQKNTNVSEPMEEMEMEEIMVEEQIIDIDGRDSKNTLAAVDYVEDIYSYYRRVEGSSCVSPDYMEEQPDINGKMRAILIDWLVEVHDKFELMEETLFLTVNLIDRFLAKQTVVRKKLQLVGLVAMLLACKYEEVSVPVVGDLILISDKAYTRKEVLEMETLMLNTLQFNMSLPTPYVFMKRFLKAAQSDKKLALLSFLMMELSLVEYEMLKFPPSLLAASSIYTAQCTLYGFKQWSKACEWHSTYSEDQLLECSRLMTAFHQKAATGKLTGVHRKYCAPKFGYIGKCEPITSSVFL